MISEITVYTRPGCSYCSGLRSDLHRSGVTFCEIDIWDNPDAAEFVRSVADGNETVPTVTVGSISMVNPSVDQVMTAIG
ncbi:MAG: glutaredoxin family protein [Ilumatobacteraceae bacterium]